MAPQAPLASVDLRPLTTSELIDRGFSLYRQHFAGLLLVALLSQAGPLLVQMLTTMLHLMPTQEDVALAATGTLARLGVFVLIVLVSQLITFGFGVVMSRYVADAYLGNEPAVTGSFRALRGRLLGVVWTCVLNRIFYALALLFPFLVGLAVEVWYLDAPPRSFAGLIVLLGGGGLLLVASLVPVLVVVMRLMVTVPVLALEQLTGWRACRRSSALVRYDPGLGFSYWGETRLSLLLLPLFVIQLLTSTLTSIPMVIAQINDMVRHGTTTPLTNYSDVVVVGSQVLTYLAGALILPLYVIAVTLFYYDVRIRREGFDLEFLAQRVEATP